MSTQIIYSDVIAKTEQMVGSRSAQKLANKYGLGIVNVTWEDTGRPTEHAGPKFEPPGWWDDFWTRHHADTGQTQEDAVEMLNDLLGHDWSDRTVGEVEQTIRVKRRAAN